MLVSAHLWNKNDFSIYRVSNIKHRILHYMENTFQKIADNTKDNELFNEMKAIYCRWEFAEDNQLLEIADAFDMFWKSHCNDVRVKAVVDTLIKDSLILTYIGL